VKGFSILLGCLISAASSALFAGETCNPDSFSNPDLITCGQQTFQKVDGVLNEQYKKALSTLAPAEQSHLREVQKNWVRFKESFCEELYQAALPGAEAPIEKLGCLVQTTNARLGELIALQTGLPLDGFYKAASAIAGKDRERNLAASSSWWEGINSMIRFGRSTQKGTARWLAVCCVKTPPTAW